MSMKKITKKMLAIVAAAAMTMGMAMPAMAADEGALWTDKSRRHGDCICPVCTGIWQSG